MNRKKFTFGLILFALLGIGLNAYGQSVGDYVFTGGTSDDWNVLGNWGTSNDGTLTNTTAATALPNGANNVWIPTGTTATIGALSISATTTTTGVTSGSTTVTLSASNASIRVGMSVTGTGIATGTTVAAISGTTLTLSTAATASSSGTAVTLTIATVSSTTQTTTATGVTSGSTSVALSASNASIWVGMGVTGSGIPGNTFVSAISGTTLTLSQAATTSSTAAVTLTFTVISSTTASSPSGGITSGSASVTLSSSNTSIFPGMYVTGYGIPNNTTVSAISGTTLTLSKAATVTSTASATLTFAPGCKNLYVTGILNATGALNCTDSVTVYNGGLFTTATLLTCTGDIYVNTGGTLSMTSTVYCPNIFNFGTFNAGTAQYNSPKSLFAGFIGETPGTGAYSIVNNGIFGGTGPSSTIGTGTPAVGSGIRIYYSEQCTSFTIGTSAPGITGYAFNIGAIEPNFNNAPTPSSPSNQASTLNLNENMSLLYNGGYSLTIQQGNQTGATRTCNIPVGVTVYSGGRFHSNANAPTTTLSQGNFVYNVYGTLDLSSYIYSASANATDFDLWLTTVSGNTGNITFNLGDGTHAASLLLGKSIKLVKQSSQSINFNFNTNSTVTFASSTVQKNIGGAVYTLQDNGNPALYLFPKSYYNLTISNDTTILPVIPSVRNTYTYTGHGYTTPNWKASTSYPASTTSVSGMVQGGVIYTGTNYYYVPVVDPTSTFSGSVSSISLAGDTILQYIQPAQVISGSGIATGSVVSTISGSAVTMTAPTSTAESSPVYLTFTGTSGTVAPTGTSSNPYVPVFDGTQGLIYLGSASFATPIAGSATSVNLVNSNNVLVYSTDNQIIIKGAQVGDLAIVYNISGIEMAVTKVTSDYTTINAPSAGVYLVKVGNQVTKVLVR